MYCQLHDHGRLLARRPLRPLFNAGHHSIRPLLKFRAVDEAFWNDIQSAQEELAELESEKNQALNKASRSSKRAERLLQSTWEYYRVAMDRMKNGNEEAARQLIQTKASIVRAMESARERTSINTALASKLEDIIKEKQFQLLFKILEADSVVDNKDQ